MKQRHRFHPLLLLVLLSACDSAPVDLRHTIYDPSGPDPGCANLRRENSVEVTSSAQVLGYSLRAPANFDPLRRHPLLVVFPAAGQTSRQSEAFTRFTGPATARGLIVLYPAHRHLSLPQVKRLGSLVEDVATNWCVDSSRIFFTGHSDGGTVAQVLTQKQTMAIAPAKIAPSAAGVRAKDLEELGCHTRIPVMLMHNEDDELFPAFGRSARDWWLSCNACQRGNPEIGSGCEIYRSCAMNTSLRFCESSGGHRKWVQSREQILDFLLGPEA